MGEYAYQDVRYTVRRIYNRYGDADFLIGWDIIWGPVWGGLHSDALVFNAIGAARAAESARDIMRPRPWCVPDFGNESHVHTSFAYTATIAA